MLYLKGIRIMMFQLSGFYFKVLRVPERGFSGTATEFGKGSGWKFAVGYMSF